MSCLVLGNGKSIENLNLPQLVSRYESWVGCCLAFRKWNILNIHPTYYVCVNKTVCETNPEVIEYVKMKKCKKYLLSESVKNIWKDYPKDGSVLFIEDLKRPNTESIFKLSNNYCSGTSSVLFGLEYHDHVNIAGFDLDYVTFIPEYEKLSNGHLRITKTPDNNPNYFFSDYQQEGDIYINHDETKHLKSWKELSMILNFIKQRLRKDKSVTNFNSKISISEYITTLSLDDLFTENKKDIAFLVPTTSNKRDWKSFTESYLNKIFLPSITILTHNYNITVYIGYDDDDKLYSNIDLPDSYDDISLKWIDFDKSFKGKPTHIWNSLAYTCINDGFEYYQVCGDDIRFDPNPNWLTIFINKLKENDNIGYSAGYSNNFAIPTQFLLHKNHYEMFGWVYPPEITEWQCDDFIYHLYENNGSWFKGFNHYNVGGEPRYTPTNPVELRVKLVELHKKTLNQKLNELINKK